MASKNISIAVLLVLSVLASGATTVAVAQQGDPPGLPANFYGNATNGGGTDVPVGVVIYAVVTDNGAKTDVGSITVEEAGQYGGPDSTEDKTLSIDSSAGDTVQFYIDDPEAGIQADQTFDVAAGGDGTYEQPLTFSGAQFNVDSVRLELGTTSLNPGDTTETTVTAFRTDGSTTDVTDQATITSTNDSVVNVSGSTIRAINTGAATVESSFRGNTDSVAISVEGPVEDTVDNTSTPSGGGSVAPDADNDGGNVAPTLTPTDSDDSSEERAPTIQEIRELLKFIETTATRKMEVADTDLGTPGIQGTPERPELTQQISFDRDSLSGNVSINEYEELPQDIRSVVAESVYAYSDSDLQRGDVSVISVANITPDNENTEYSGAAVEFELPANAVDNPEQLTVFKESYETPQEESQGIWSERNTTVKNVSNGNVTISAPVERFSLFVISENKSNVSVYNGDGQQPDGDGQQPDGDGQQPDGDGQQPDGDGQRPDDDSLVTATLISFLIVAIAAIVLYAGEWNQGGPDSYPDMDTEAEGRDEKVDVTADEAELDESLEEVDEKVDTDETLVEMVNRLSQDASEMQKIIESDDLFQNPDTVSEAEAGAESAVPDTDTKSESHEDETDIAEAEAELKASLKALDEKADTGETLAEKVDRLSENVDQLQQILESDDLVQETDTISESEAGAESAVPDADVEDEPESRADEADETSNRDDNGQTVRKKPDSDQADESEQSDVQDVELLGDQQETDSEADSETELSWDELETDPPSGRTGSGADGTGESDEETDDT